MNNITSVTVGTMRANTTMSTGTRVSGHAAEMENAMLTVQIWEEYRAEVGGDA